MAFLTTLEVYDLKSLVDGLLGFLGPHNFKGVHSTDKRIFASFRVREFHRVGSSLVSDQTVDLASLIWMSLLMHGQTHELVRWEVFVEPLQGVLCESLPVCISTADEMSGRCRIAHLIGVPHGLASGVSNVLGRARDCYDIRLVLVDLDGVDGSLLLLPRMLVLETIELDVVKWIGAVYNGFLAIKECRNLLAILNIVLVGGDGDDLVPCDVIFSDP